MTPDTPAMDEKGLRAATAAVTAEIDRYWSDDSVEPGHEPVARAAIAAYLAATARDGDTDILEACARICDAEADKRQEFSNAAGNGSRDWGDPERAHIAQGHKSVTARQLAYEIRKLRSSLKASQEAEVVAWAWRYESDASKQIRGVDLVAPDLKKEAERPPTTRRIFEALVVATPQPSPEADGAR